MDPMFDPFTAQQKTRPISAAPFACYATFTVPQIPAENQDEILKNLTRLPTVGHLSCGADIPVRRLRLKMSRGTGGPLKPDFGLGGDVHISQTLILGRNYDGVPHTSRFLRCVGFSSQGH
jgi:hypothetical protein